MRGLLGAFGTIWAVAAVGWAISRYRLLGPGGETVLARLVFFVATPALLFDTLSTADLKDVFTPALTAFVLSALAVTGAFLAWARLAWRRPLGETVVGALSASYVNAANLGIPVAAYALGDVGFAAPILIFQLLLAAPISLALLDADARGGRPSLTALATLPARNPIMVASAAGLAVSISGWSPPPELSRPFELVGAAAVPLALLALGMSLHGTGVAAPGAETGARYVVVTLKVLVQPLLAYAIGRFVLGLEGRLLFAAVVTSGLPTAQNIFVYAAHYGRAPRLARDAVVVSTVLAAASLPLIAAWLG